MVQLYLRLSIVLVTAIGIFLCSSIAPVYGMDLEELDPIKTPALRIPDTTASFMISVVRAGDRVVAVGERGGVIFSDDNGKTWSQAQVPVRVSLTDVCFVDGMNGWAVGHSGIVIATVDGGKTWRKLTDGLEISRLVMSSRAAETPDEEEPDYLPLPRVQPGDPFLCVYFSDKEKGFIAGAFGVILRTLDGGKRWESWERHLPNKDGNHLYDIQKVGSILWIAAERGNIFMSRDGGETFTACSSRYEGTYFGICQIAEDVLIYGLRGNAFRSSDIGNTWQTVGKGDSATWNGSVTLTSGDAVLVNQEGDVTYYEKKGAVTNIVYSHIPFPLSDVVETADGTLVVVGFRGTRVVDFKNNVRGK